MKRDKRACTECGSKESLNVHHLEKARLDLLVAHVRRYLLHPHTDLTTLCRECHLEEHRGER